MFFRNLTMFRFSPAVAADLSRLDEALPEHRLRPVGPMELSTRGFVSPLGRAEEALTHTVGQNTMVVVGFQDKLLPSGVVNDELAVRIQKIVDEEDRKVGGRERKKIKDDVLNDLLPRAFVRQSRLALYVDVRGGWVVFDTSSRKSAENALSQIREALGSFPAVPLAPEESPRILMTHWVATGELPAGFALGDQIELRDPATASGAIARCTRQDLDTDEVREHLRTGKQVFKIGLIFDDRISFVLGEDLVLSKVKFTDVVMDEQADSPESAAAEMDANFALMTLEYERLLSKLAELFQLPRPE
jgi:recombination associated protein RdgC